MIQLSLLRSAIRRGELRRPGEYPCTDCGGEATEYDHRDYSFPLLVDPVCRGCNVRRGKAIPRQWATEEFLVTLRRQCHTQRIVPWARDWCIERIEWMCEAVEDATLGAITRHDLRPDLWPVAKPRREQRRRAQ